MSLEDDGARPNEGTGRVKIERASYVEEEAQFEEPKGDFTKRTVRVGIRRIEGRGRCRWSEDW